MHKRVFSPVILIAILFALMAPAQSRPSFTGVITDSMCDNGDHSVMRMGPTDAECTIACIEDHDASYLLYDGKEAYFLSDQETPRKFAGKKVIVTGTLDAAKKTIHVEKIVLASGNH